MSHNELEEELIRNYQKEENMMILVFAQWCMNNDIDPEALYRSTYPQQENNPALKQSLELTVPKEEAGEIADDTVIGVLSLFGNDELAFAVTEAIKQRKK
jgi:hypothetical protein